MKEIWKRLHYHGKDYGDWYEVSNSGNIRNAKTHKIRKLNVSKTGYYFVTCSLGSRQNKILFKVHRAVAESFILNPDNLPCINHIDGNKLNNSVNNLEWCTMKYNTNHAVKLGLLTVKKGYDNTLSKLTKEQYEYIYNFYQPFHKDFGSRALARKFGVHHETIRSAYKYMSELN